MMKSQEPKKRCARKIIFSTLLNCLITNVTSNPAVGKCCPSGQVFSVKENFTCAYSKDHNRQLYQLKKHSDYHVFDGCRDSQNLTITSLGDIADGIIRGPAACIDLLWDEKIGQTIPIVFQCQENNEKNNEGNYGTLPTSENLVGPILTSIGICCRANNVFDTNKRDCVYRNDADDILNDLKFLDDRADFVAIVRGPPKCNHAIIDQVVNVTRDLRVLDDGRLEVTVPWDYGGILASEENSCLDPGVLGAPDLMVFRVCTDSTYCNKNTCVRKCCPEGEAMFDSGCNELSGQVPAGRFHDVLVNASVTRGSAGSTEFIDTRDYGLLIGKPCKYGMFPVEPNEEWHLTRRGEIVLPLYRAYENHEYCIDMFYESQRNDNEQLYPFVCFDEPTDTIYESRLRYKIFAVLELISCAFLLFTLLVYICLPVLRNLHGKTLMCHVASLIVAYSTLATVALATPSNTGDPGGTHFCTFLGFTLLLSWIAAFSWLNVMCFDIWWTFGGLDGVGVDGRHGRAYKKRFIVYSLYAWGLALFVTVIGVAVDHTEILPLYLRPNIGSDSCWFERNIYYYGEIIFFVGPVSIQLVANVIFFYLTAKYCSKVKAEITRVMAAPSDPRSTRFHADRTKLIMNVKLFIVMGVTWSLEVISSFLNHYATSLTWRNEFFFVSDLINCLQGVLIFILFVLKRKVYYALRRRLGHEKNKKPVGQQGGLQDPYRVRNSASSSTIMSTFGATASSP